MFQNILKYIKTKDFILFGFPLKPMFDVNKITQIGVQLIEQGVSELHQSNKKVWA